MNTVFYLSTGLAFIISLILCPLYIAFARRQQFGQQIRKDGPRRHLSKAGTPTMGGVVFLFSLVVTLLFFAPKTFELFAILFITLGMAIIGYIDDYQKVALKRSLGLRAREKFFAQFLLVLVFYGFLIYRGHSTVIDIPFTAFELELGLFYPLFIFVMISGTSNAVNLTDGIDGLAGGAAIIAFFAYFFIATFKGLTEIAFFCSSFIGACFGFLLYNLHPAKVFMGDVGSLALGSALAAVAIITKAELTLAIVGGLFVIETLSVIVQVFFFQLTGKRVFLMSPLHHHFEVKGHSEWQVVIMFWSLAFLFALLGLLPYTLPLQNGMQAL